MIVADEDQMLAFGESLAVQLTAGDWLAIDGPLGAGKTVLCKGIIRGLGFTGDVTSPSYAIAHHYSPPDISVPVIHADLYRLSGQDEIDEIGMTDGAGDCITLVEWARNADENFGNPTYRIIITPMDNGNRQISMVKFDG
jgi:tRNA threonylcarbamoyladenosine biosynthesis protein TsaE